MPLSILFAFALAQTQTGQQVQITAGSKPPLSFSQGYEVLEPNRLALTPRVDGKIEEEEWDEIGAAGMGKAYFQWEPGKLHIAGVVPEGCDLMASFDLRQDGWLHGADNLQLRISTVDGKASVTGKILDGTRVSGPVWVEIPGFTMSSVAAAQTAEGKTTFEATVSDPGIGLLPEDTAAKMAIRVDAPLATDLAFEPYLPRTLTNVTLGLMRSAALPAGLKFNVEGLNKSVTPGEWVRLRLTFNGNNNMNLSQLAMRTEGLGKDATSKVEAPFPKFDAKGRSFVDYDTSVADAASLGYRILRAQLKSGDGVDAMLQACYRIAAPVEFEMVRQATPVSPTDRSVKYGFYVKSNTGKRATGKVVIEVPQPLRVLNGATRDVQIAGRQKPRMDFLLFVPQSTVGTFPVTFKSTLNGVTSEQYGYITIGG